jgi:hypothetical protein
MPLNNFNQKIWRCHECQNLVGPTYVHATSTAKSLEMPGTDWQRFYSYTEYKQHMQQIHGKMLGKPADAEGKKTVQHVAGDNCFAGGWG